MASSRLERLGTIYTRITGLLRRGAMKEDDKPLWYEIYKAFPPEQEPRRDRPIPNVTIKPIFYAEDTIRAKFHKSHEHLRSVKLSDSDNPSSTQQFISIYNRLKNERKEESEDQLFKEALDLLGVQNVTFSTQEKDQSQILSIVDSFTEAKKNKDTTSKVNIKDTTSTMEKVDIENIFKES